MEKLTIEQFTVWCENREEALKIKQEIFSHHIYFFETENQTPLIIDAGAHIGIATLYFKKLYPNAQVIAIEPHPVSFKLLQKNVEENYLENVTLINAAFSAHQTVVQSIQNPEPASRTFHADTEFNWFSTASFQAGSWNKSQRTESFSVPILSLSTVLETTGKRVDLLKMDIEGAEQAVLSEARSNLSKVEHIICEFHMTENQNRELFLSFLEKQGYSVTHENKKETFHGPRQLEMIEATKKY